MSFAPASFLTGAGVVEVVFGVKSIAFLDLSSGALKIFSSIKF